MDDEQRPGFGQRLKNIVIGEGVNLGDRSLFHRLSLIAFFAWVGLGADGLSSSCYGPFEAFAALGEHSILALIVGLMTAVTIFVIAASYSQIIELFPDGGGGYFVASRLLSPKLGMFSGCALIIDYVLTITLSIASGADAIFSLLPVSLHAWKVPVAILGIVLITVMNLRGVKESVQFLVPVFMVFVLTHAFAIIYAVVVHAMDGPAVAARLAQEVQVSHAELGTFGLAALLLRAYSMGAGTYTGLEAVSNGLPMLREPRVQTGKRTMLYMAASLAVTVLGLMTAYVLFNVRVEEGKTLNATLFGAMTASWSPGMGQGFILVTLASEALLLFVAAQTGFLDGPRVLSNMALDRWLPGRFSVLSDRLVSQNGILCFSFGALVLMLASQGNVSHLVVLYSINVFITFVLSQAGMVRHWWQARATARAWRRKLAINGIGLLVTASILCSVVIVKFDEGGWITLVVTSLLVALALVVRRHYDDVGRMVRKLDLLVGRTEAFGLPVEPLEEETPPSRQERTAVLLVGGYNGLGISSLLSLLKYHGRNFSNLVFLQVGVVDASVFRRPEDLEALKTRLAAQTGKYADLVRRHGFHAEAVWAVGTDVVEEVVKLAPALSGQYPRAVFFGGQLVFKEDSFFERVLHNYQSFSLQRSLFRMGIPFELIPLRIEEGEEEEEKPEAV